MMLLGEEKRNAVKMFKFVFSFLSFKFKTKTTKNYCKIKINWSTLSYHYDSALRYTLLYRVLVSGTGSLGSPRDLVVLHDLSLCSLLGPYHAPL